MQDTDSSPQSAQVQIAEAIRAKRERRSSMAVRQELEAMEASLLADIDTFDLDSMARQVQAEENRSRASGLVTDTQLAFPDIVAEGATPRLQAAGAVQPQSNTPAAAPAGLQLSSSSLLDQLRHEAEKRQNLAEAEQHKLTLLEGQLDQSLRQVFAYLHELVQQLNIIKPPIARAYLVPGNQELQGLVWQQGFCDYRSRPQSAGASLESVSFNYTLAGGRGLVLERDGTLADSFRQQLFDLNLQVRVEEFRNERRYLERARFLVAPEVKVNVRWEADYQAGKLVVLSRNLERLGGNRHVLPADAVSQALLDEFGRMVLGQPHQFPRLLSR